MAYSDRVTSEHADKPKFRALVDAMTGNAQAVTDLLASLPMKFDPDDAVGSQLDDVGRWVGLTRNLVSPIDDIYFSWDIADVGWDQGVWKRIGDPDSGISTLDDETYRLFIRAKIQANHWNGIMEDSVAIMHAIFDPAGLTATITDNQDMTMTVTITGGMLPPLYAALINGGYLPIKPMGVSVTYVLPA